MIRRGLLLVLLIFGCAPLNDDRDQQTDNPPVVILSSDYSLDVSRGLKLMLAAKDPGLPFRKIEKKLFLLKKPSREFMAFDEKFLEPLVLKRTKHQGQFSLESLKNPTVGEHYGVYYGDSLSGKLALIYTFRAHALPPRLLLEPEDKAQRRVHYQRVLFKFVFDQPIYLHDDQAISLISLEENIEAPKIENIVVEPDRKTVSVRLKTGGKFLQVGKVYAFLFNSGLRNSNEQNTDQAPWQFMVSGEPFELEFSMTKPLAVSTSSNSAEFKWLADMHDMHIFVEDEEGRFVYSLDTSFGSIEKNLGGGRLLLTELKSNSTYRFFARGEHLTGKFVEVRGAMKTAPEDALRISEIMIRPRIEDREYRGEYIEVANVSDRDITLQNLSISVEDKETSKITDCEIEHSFPVFVNKGGYFLIVGGEFSTDTYGLDNNQLILRLKQKTLCGGLSNEREKIIKLHRGDSHFIDRFGGYLWASAPGQSVERINLKGLDEPNNYCYSKKAPTPGKINEPCGRSTSSSKRFKGGRT